MATKFDTLVHRILGEQEDQTWSSAKSNLGNAMKVAPAVISSKLLPTALGTAGQLSKSASNLSQSHKTLAGSNQSYPKMPQTSAQSSSWNRA